MSYLTPTYQMFCDKVHEIFGKEIVSQSEFDEAGITVPLWADSYCRISQNEYYFGPDIDYFEPFRDYTDDELEALAERVQAEYGTLRITPVQLLKLREKGVTVPTWARRQRVCGKGLLSFEKGFTRWCPLPSEVGNIMEFKTQSGQDVNHVDIDSMFDGLTTEVEKTAPVVEEVVEEVATKDETDFDVADIVPVEKVEIPVAPQVPMMAAPAFDMEMVEVFAERFAEAFHRKEPVKSVPPKPKGFYIPDVDKLFIKWGIYKDIEMILKRNMFYPCYITGLSGNGKTMGIDQACANLKKELVTVNITQETDEDDLLGGYRLIDGNTVWQDGPVIIAMKRGAALLLDEIDYGSSKLSCLQSVLSGKPVLLKKTGEVVKPKAGFTVFATANTKGQGDNTGKFAGTKIMNEAFLDRFPITLHNPYPPKDVEIKIFTSALTHYRFVYDGGKELDADDKDFMMRLVHWCDIIRKTHEQGAITEVISTRRGVDILKSYVIFGSRERAIQVGTERFDEQTRIALGKLYSAVDEQVKRDASVNSADKAKAAMRNARAAVASSNDKKEDPNLGTDWNERMRRAADRI